MLTLLSRNTLLALGFAVLFSACGTTSVGAACTADENCDRGQLCFTALPGGFCSKTCSTLGSTAECPADTVCTQHSAGILCAPICQNQDDCRAEYECNGLTGAAVKSCRPKV